MMSETSVHKETKIILNRMITAVGMDPLPVFLVAKMLRPEKINVSSTPDAFRAAECLKDALRPEDWLQSEFDPHYSRGVEESFLHLSDITGENIAVFVSAGGGTATVGLTRLADKLTENNNVSLVYIDMQERRVIVEPQSQAWGPSRIDIDITPNIDEMVRLAGVSRFGYEETDLSTLSDKKRRRLRERKPLVFEVAKVADEINGDVAVYPRVATYNRAAAIVATKSGRIIVIDDDSNPEETLRTAYTLNGESGAAVIVSNDPQVHKLNRVRGFYVTNNIVDAVNTINDGEKYLGRGTPRYKNSRIVYKSDYTQFST